MLLLDVLYILCSWHAFAKLRLHTSSTLKILDGLTIDFGSYIRDFQRMAHKNYDTQELPKEKAARLNRRGKTNTKEPTNCSSKPGTGSEPIPAPPSNDIVPLPATGGLPSAKGKTGEKVPSKPFSLRTYKFHAMGHYVDTIQRYGTTDSFTTEIVSATA